MNKYDKVIGPVGLYHYYSEFYDLDIYLMADLHKICAKCVGDSEDIWINDFIVNNIKYNKKLSIDLFLETPYLTIKGTRETPNLNKPFKSYIQKVVKSLHSCFSLYDSCPISNLRPHFLDFRHACNSKNRRLWYYYEQYDKDLNPDESDEVVLEDVKCTYYELKSCKHDNILDAIVELYDIDNIMKSQYDVMNAKPKRLILTFLNAELERLIPGGKKGVLKGLKMFINNFYTAPKTKLADYLKDYGEADTWVLDYYMFGRLFRNYGRECCKNAIYYAGAYHINNTIKLLEKMKFELLERSESEYQCIDIKDIEQPLFSLVRGSAPCLSTTCGEQ